MLNIFGGVFMDNEKIGKFIYECRVKKNMTQKELASKLNITDRAVSKWERGIGCPDISLLTDLSSELDVSIDELLVGEKNNNIIQEDDYIIGKKDFSNVHPILKKYVVVIIYILLIVSVLAIMLPCIIIARNFLGIIIFISLSFFTSMIIVKIYGNKKIEDNVWLFWQLLYSVILILCFFLTRIFNYYVEPYWDNFYSITPFKMISEYLYLYSIGFQNFYFLNYYLLNKIYIMIPFPILFGIKANKKFWFIEIIGFCILFSFMRECYQYLSGNGVFDIDDIILNLIGCCIGVFICIIYRKVKYKLKRREVL